MTQCSISCEYKKDENDKTIRGVETKKKIIKTSINKSIIDFNNELLNFAIPSEKGFIDFYLKINEKKYQEKDKICFYELQLKNVKKPDQNFTLKLNKNIKIDLSISLTYDINRNYSTVIPNNNINSNDFNNLIKKFSEPLDHSGSVDNIKNQQNIKKPVKKVKIGENVKTKPKNTELKPKSGNMYKSKSQGKFSENKNYIDKKNTTLVSENTVKKEENNDNNNKQSIMEQFISFFKRDTTPIENNNNPKKHSVTLENYNLVQEESIQKEEIPQKNIKQIFLESQNYEEFLKKTNIKKNNRETFCEGFFISSFPKKDGQVIENSQNFPAPCGHEDCSSLPAMKPEIISRYPLTDTKNLELNNLAATICFPTGIKVCYSENNCGKIKDYVTSITNQKGERYYMMTFHFYYKIDNINYSKMYEMHPLKRHLQKFGDEYLNLTDEQLENVKNKIEENLEKAQNLDNCDYVFVPFCMCLISKYPYVEEMKKCLNSIYNLLNIENINSNIINDLIMYLIHSIPIPEKSSKLKFYIPYYSNGIELSCPKEEDISIMNTNLSDLLKYFRIDNIVLIFRFILFEKKILFFYDDYSILSSVTDSFLTLLYPFKWIHTYIPIMSDQMLSYLETFLPFVNGINSSLIDLVKDVFWENQQSNDEEVFIVYISKEKDKDKVRLGESLTTNKIRKQNYIKENVPPLPYNLEYNLKKKLKDLKYEIESFYKNNNELLEKGKLKNELYSFDLKIRNVFIEMFVEMFHDYYKYMGIVGNDIVFNKNLFMETIDKNDKEFYDEFIDTQLFQQFSQNFIKDELSYFKNMAIQYDKKEELNLKINHFSNDTLYIAEPEFLKIYDKDTKKIEESLNKKFPEINNSEERILNEFELLKDDNYKNVNCKIYKMPEINISSSDNKKKNSNNIINNTIIRLLEKSNQIKSTTLDNDGLKDEIKELIKDFTVKIIKGETVENDQKFKKDLLNALNSFDGREFFISLISNNINVVLLDEKSFNILGIVIYETLLHILKLPENNKTTEQMVKLFQSMMFFGKKEKDKEINLWEDHLTKIKSYAKIKQHSFWQKWYEVNINKEDNPSEETKEIIILNICDIMLTLRINKSFVKNVIGGLADKIFGKESEKSGDIKQKSLENIRKVKYEANE